MSSAGTPAKPYSLDEIAAMRLGHDRDGNVVAADRARLFVTADNALTEIARLAKIEERAKQAARPFNDLRGSEPSPEIAHGIRLATYILEGGDNG